MSNRLMPALEKMQQEANNAEDTKKQIINAYNTDEYVMSQIRTQVADMLKEASRLPEENLHIDLEDIETLVLRKPLENEQDTERE